MKKTIILSLLAGISATLLALHPAFAKELVVNKGIIDKDTTWSGQVLIKGDVEIAEGATLMIMPGTTVRFAKVEPFGPEKLFMDKEQHFSRAELFIRGKLHAQGTREQKITFTSAEKSPNPGDWGSVNLQSTVDNVLEYCVFMYGQTAVHCHSSQVLIINSTFKHNGTAIGQKNLKENPIKCVIPMFYNLITKNGGGILFGGGTTPTISHNEITENKFFGIYVKKGGKANIRLNNITKNGKGVIFFKVKEILLRDNNISDNVNYNISMLDGQDGDITAKNNWWGSTDEQKILAKVMDKGRDETLGKVDLSDFRSTPVVGAGIL
ncbi:MAG: right-handed parallel beta-helix repeat-containing protein [Candidatus Electrothrix sp. AR4]|nr:right-handed parallel beta-helix repeat-containing protein [Candidatus Electrothrix sp. AR4]